LNRFPVTNHGDEAPLSAAAALISRRVRQREKYVFALGQSPEGFALMKTDPLQSGSKVSKIESPQKVGTNFLLEFFLSP
jgi:hypothetical protein